MNHICGWPTRTRAYQIIARTTGLLARVPRSTRTGNRLSSARPLQTQQTSCVTHPSHPSRFAKGSLRCCSKIVSSKVENYLYARSYPNKTRETKMKRKLQEERCSEKLADHSYVRWEEIREMMTKRVNLKYRWPRWRSIRRAPSSLYLRGIPGWTWRSEAGQTL